MFLPELKEIRKAELKAIISKYSIFVKYSTVDREDKLINELADYLEVNDKPIITYVKQLQGEIMRLKTKEKLG